MKKRKKNASARDSITRRHVAEKRRKRFKRRCLAFFKLCLLCIFLVGLGFAGKEAYIRGSAVFNHYRTIYQDYEARKQERRAEIDERFDGYTNILVLGLDEGMLVPDERAVAAHQAWVENKAQLLASQEKWEREQAALQLERAQNRAAREAERQQLIAERAREAEEAGAAMRVAAQERGEQIEESKLPKPEPVPELEPEPAAAPSPDFSIPAEPDIPYIRVGQQADTVMVVSLNNATGEVRIISVPRGTLVDIPELHEKDVMLNNVFAEGGSSLMVRTVSRLLGISLHHYVELDTEFLAQFIDTLGGIDVYVETDMFYEDPEAGLKIDLPQGYRHMDGDTVQKYLRYRSGELGDIGRLQRQQRFTRAAFAALLKPANVTKLPKITELMQHKLSTSAEIWDSAHLLKLLHSIKGEPQTIMLPGSSVYGIEGAWKLDMPAVESKIKELFPELENN